VNLTGFDEKPVMRQTFHVARRIDRRKGFFPEGNPEMSKVTGPTGGEKAHTLIGFIMVGGKRVVIRRWGGGGGTSR